MTKLQYQRDNKVRSVRRKGRGWGKEWSKEEIKKQLGNVGDGLRID